MLRTSPYTPEYDLLRNWLKAKRKEAGLTIHELAERLESAHAVVGKIEKGDRSIEIFEYIDICKALDANPVEGLKAAGIQL